jgi:hypothetical protein
VFPFLSVTSSTCSPFGDNLYLFSLTSLLRPSSALLPPATSSTSPSSDDTDTPSCATVRLPPQRYPSSVILPPRFPSSVIPPSSPFELHPSSFTPPASSFQRHPSSSTPLVSPFRRHPSSLNPSLIPTPRPRHRNAYSRSKVIICSVFFFSSCSRSRVCLSLFCIVSTPSTRQRPHLRQSSDNVFSKRDRPQTSTFTSGRVERFRCGARIGGKGYFRDDAVARCVTL